MVLFGALILASCRQKETFVVNGTIEGVKEGEMLYLETEGIDQRSVLDSVKLSDTGEFEMEALRPEAPDFYRLRIGDELVHFCVDSTETQSVTGNRTGLSANYRITGNYNSQKMKEIVAKQQELQRTVANLTRKVQNGSMTEAWAKDSLSASLSRYKEDMRLNYIFAEPNKPYAYYALFQQIDGFLLFDVNDKRDIRLFQAVGTCMDTYWPEAVRTKNLHNVVMKGLQGIRMEEVRSKQEIPKDKITETGVIEIKLPDRKGAERSLTSLKGKVVLLDFVAQGDRNASKHNLFLRGLYNKYKDQGLVIYQVSQDADEHYWRTVTEALPWICVREKDEAPSAIAVTYNVTSLPTMFLISRDNVLLTRHNTAEGVEEAIKKQL